ncbi:MAG: SpoVR family protein [Alphaproteobacteria bacterium]|nr:SpoVR family protein [Alphaproteobacteria bacterium]
MSEEKKDYKAQISELLSHYEDGAQIFINAYNAKNWRYPVNLKEESKGDPSLPRTWIELSDKVISIIATEKYGLNCHANEIQIITAEQMNEALANVGLPVSIPHWENGVKSLAQKREYEENPHLPFEIVINSNPSIAYCMEDNLPFMQQLVIAHACYGHNAFFKNNYMFKDHTDADTIIDDLIRFRDFIYECETKYGWQEVETVMDFCSAMRFMDVYRDIRPKQYQTTEEQKSLKQERVQDKIFEKPIKKFGTSTGASKSELNSEFNESAQGRPEYAHRDNENVLMFIAEKAPHVPNWAREIMRMRSKISQYFWPQMHTKVFNEGFASYTHYLIMTDLHEMKLMDDGTYLQFTTSHGGVLRQPEFDETRKFRAPDGSIKERQIYNGINPYALGFAILDDIKRISMEPTAEDKKWFPEFAGNGKWWENIKYAAFHHNDHEGITQYLSPEVMRNFKFFTTIDDKSEQSYEIGAIHDRDGYENLRRALAKDNKITDMIPDIRVHDCHERTDRALILRHYVRNGKVLDDGVTPDVLMYMHQLWGHPVVIESVDEDGEILNVVTSSRDYDYDRSCMEEDMSHYFSVLKM